MLELCNKTQMQHNGESEKVNRENNTTTIMLLIQYIQTSASSGRGKNL